jgi:phage terminase Nu1 subunit (DNA packaging protein)
VLKTPWGEPDLQGIWTVENETPLQRPAKYADQEAFQRASRATPRAVPLAKATEQRARLASAQADLAELKAAEKRGELLAAAEVERTWGGILRTVGASMLAIPSRVGARLPHLTAGDVDEIDREVRAVLTEVSKQ